MLLHRSRRARYEMDMTEGPLAPKVLRYAGPLILTGILQLLYNAADVVVVGRFAGHQALAAVSSTGSLINLLVNVFMGLSVGSSVVIARAWGAHDRDAVQKGVHTSVMLGAIGGVLIGLIGVLLARPLLQLMGSPEDVIDQAVLYIKIYFAGMPVNMLYTFGSAILRAVGDTKRPLYYLSISGLVNVGLNLLLVIVFHLGVAGVAIATVTSQALSAALVLICLIKTHGAIHLNVKKLRIDWRTFVGIVKVGLPAGIQGSLFSISNVLIQSSVNSFGSTVMAANGAACSLEGFVYTAMNAQYQADLTFSSQNLGAGKYDRVRRVLWVCLGLVAATGLAMGFLFLACGPTLLSIYNSEPEVIRWGMVRMQVIMPTYFLCGMMDVMVGQLRGVGYSVMPMIVSLTGVCVFRVLWIYTVFAANPTLQILYASYPISWGMTFLIHMATYLLFARKKLLRMERDAQRAA